MFVMSIIFINDLVDLCSVTIKMYLFADGAKLYCHVKNNGNMEDLQTVIKKFVEWTDIWQMKLNIEKYKVISFHH